jgi:hypothetical protein
MNDPKNNNSITSKTSDSGDKEKMAATAAMHDEGGMGSGAEKFGRTKITDTSGGIKFGTLREFLPSSQSPMFAFLGALPGNLVKEKGALIGTRIAFYRSELEDGRCQEIPHRHGLRTTKDPPNEATCASAYRVSSKANGKFCHPTRGKGRSTASDKWK